MASLKPPAGMDVYADQGDRVVSSGIALIVLPTFFVILRFVSRSIANAGLWWDDLLVLLALLLSYGPNISMMTCKLLHEAFFYECVPNLIKLIAARYEGFGKHLWALPQPERNTSQFLKILYIYIIFYYAAVVMIKLCMYGTGPPD